MVKKAKTKQRCPWCNHVVSEKRALNLRNAKVMKAIITLYKTGELGRNMADIRLAQSDLEEEE